MNKTLRLIIPQWKGGDNPIYAFGAELLAFIAPPSIEDTVIEVDIDTNFDNELIEEHGILGESVQLQELKNTMAIIRREDPDKIIVFGGDCSVSQAPFDYLSQKYGQDLGIIWLDAHPDISTRINSNHNHEYILANLMGIGESRLAHEMGAPVRSDHVLYAGLVEDSREKMLKLGLDIPIITPEEIVAGSGMIESFLEKHKISRVCVHFDLDVLSPETFRSLTSSKPLQTLEEYGAAVGKLTLDDVVSFLKRVEKHVEIVGLSIAEYVPWDALALRDALSQISIFT